MDQSKWINDMLSMARVSFETGMRTMDTFQQQAEKAIDLTMNNANLVQDESRRSVSAWIESVKKARKLYSDAIEEGMSNIEKQFLGMGKSK